MPFDEASMDEMLADIVHRTKPDLYKYLAFLTFKGVSMDDILDRVETRAPQNSLTYLSIKATLMHFQRKVKEKHESTR